MDYILHKVVVMSNCLECSSLELLFLVCFLSSPREGTVGLVFFVLLLPELRSGSGTYEFEA